MKHGGLALALGLAVGTIFLWLAVRNIELEMVGRMLLDASLWMVWPFLTLLTLFYWLKALRWSVLLAPVMPVLAGRLLPSMMVGFAGNNILPLRLGELIRILLLSQELALPSSLVLTTVALERLLDAVALLLIVAVAMSLQPIDSEELTIARYLLLAAAAGAALLVYGIVASPPWISRLSCILVKPFPARWRDNLAHHVADIRSGLGSMNSGRIIVGLTLNSIVQWVLLAACIHVSMVAFGSNITPVAAVVVLLFIVIGISLPNAPAFIGTIEYCFVAGLGLFGVDPAKALSIAIFYHALSFVFVTLSGMYFVRHYTISWRELQRNARQFRSSGN